MTGPRLDAVAARRWTAAAVPGWVPRGLLVAGWAAAFAVAVFTDTAPCAAADPGRCGPDRGFAVVLGLVLATPVLLLVLPALGCVAGIAFGVEEVVADPLRSAAVAFGLHGAACLGVLGWLLLARVRQGGIVRAAVLRAGMLPGEAPPDDVLGPAATGGARPGGAGPGSAAPGGPAPGGAAPGGAGPGGAGPGGGPRWPEPGLRGNVRRLAAAGLLVAGIAALLLYRHDQAAVDRHLAAATREPARLTAVDDRNWRVTLLLPATEDRVTLDVIDPGPYEVGTDVPVLVDRTGEPPWVALVAEQPDPTFPLTVGVFALLLAAVALGWDAGRRRALRRLGTVPSTPVAVRVEADWDNALLHPAGGGPPFARVPLAVPLEAGRSAEPRRPPARSRTVPATAVGDLRVGGWVALHTADGTAWPAGPVALPRGSGLRPWRRLVGDGPDPDDDRPGRLPGSPVAPAATVPELPLTAGPPDRTRLLGAALLLGAAAALVATPLWAEDWWDTLVGLVLGGRALGAGATRLLVGVRLERAGLVVTGRWRTVRVPWAELHGARRDGDVLSLAWALGEAIDVGPFAPTWDTASRGTTSRETTAGGRAAGGSTEGAARRLGAAIMALRERALAAGDPGGAPSATWSPAAAVTALYAVAALAAAWLSLH